MQCLVVVPPRDLLQESGRELLPHRLASQVEVPSRRAFSGRQWRCAESVPFHCCRIIPQLRLLCLLRIFWLLLVLRPGMLKVCDSVVVVQSFRQDDDPCVSDSTFLLPSAV